MTSTAQHLAKINGMETIPLGGGLNATWRESYSDSPVYLHADESPWWKGETIGTLGHMARHGAVITTADHAQYAVGRVTQEVAVRALATWSAGLTPEAPFAVHRTAPYILALKAPA